MQAIAAIAILVATSTAVHIYPAAPIQGDPIMITVEATSTVKSIAFGGKPLALFSYQGLPTAFYGFDINKKSGTYMIVAKLADGASIQKPITIGERKKAEVAFTIPAKLGGTTPAAETTLVSTLAAENASLLGLRTGAKAFWTSPFAFPVADATVTDPYGYSRDTGTVTVTHKGTDFHAPEGTPVLAANRGVVRLVQEGRNYGKTIIVDHGLGLMTFYMHLSKIYVNQGELVQQGQVIGLSGQTGYAEGPHLHFTVRMNEISIDPMMFMGFFAR